MEAGDCALMALEGPMYLRARVGVRGVHLARVGLRVGRQCRLWPRLRPRY